MIRLLFKLLLAILLFIATLFYFRLQIATYALPKIARAFNVEVHDFKITELNTAALQLETLTLEFKLHELHQLIQLRNIAVLHNLQSVKEIKIGSASLKIWGGTVSAKNLLIHPEIRDYDIKITVKKVALEQLLRDYPQESVTATGSISGIIPLRIRDNKFTVSNGKLKGDGEGTLQVNYGDNQDLGNAELAKTSEILKDFHYQLLNTKTNLNDSGDLKLEVSLSGKNPAFQNGRQVELNFNIEENLPALLKTLKLNDSLEESALESLRK